MSELRILKITKPAKFDFIRTVRSHGWLDLLPFEFDEENAKLTFVAESGRQTLVECSVADGGEAITVEVVGEDVKPAEIERQVRHILRLDESFDPFYMMLEADRVLHRVPSRSAGRLLRSPTVFEDLVKTICTTNCSWAMTKRMVTNLVEKLGEPVGGRRAFPTPEAMASVPLEFYKEEVRAGYRSAYFVELAGRVAAGELLPEGWLTSVLTTAELKNEIKQVKGVGDYAAENLLKLLGRYDGLALDSWLRAQFYKKHCAGAVCDDKKIAKHYHHFGKWQGLAIWCDMTEDWFE